MSHFTVLVIGDNPKRLLAPYQENNMGDCPKEYLEYVDMTTEFKEEYETKSSPEFFCSSSSSWGQQISKKLFNTIKKSTIGSNHIYNVDPIGMVCFRLNKKYRGYYELLSGGRCKGDVWFEVIEITKTTHPDKNICFEGEIVIQTIAPPKELPLKEKYTDYNLYLKDWHGYEDPTQQGYWHNPNSKWDWYTLGGRWTGTFKLKHGKTGVIGEQSWYNRGEKINKDRADQARKKDIDFSLIDEYITFAVIKDGKWYQKGEMGWWGAVTNPKDEKKWSTEWKSLVKDLPGDTLLSIYDCHI